MEFFCSLVIVAVIKSLHSISYVYICIVTYHTILTQYVGPYQRIPGDIHLTITDGNQLNFSWTSVNSSCPSISYNINSNCGACPMTTNTTAAICSDPQLPSVCTFSIRSVVCGPVGMPSNPLMVILRGLL